MNIKTFEASIVGIPGSPLVVHQFGDKARKQIEDKQQKKGGSARTKPPKDPQADFLEARYLRPGTDVECIPCTAVKNAIVGGCRMTDLKMVHVRQSLFICPVDDTTSPLLPILDSEGNPAVGTMRTDAVTIGIDTRDIRYRPEYVDWQIRFRCEYNTSGISEAQVKELLRNAGFGVGLCEGRPERSSLGWGRFKLVEPEPEQNEPNNMVQRSDRVPK